MKKIILTSASVLAAMSVNSASAEGTWDGIYGGLSVGYQDAQLKGSDPNLDYYGIIGTPDPQSATGGIFGGYNYQLPNCPMVAGVEASVDFGGNTAKTDPNFRFIAAKSSVESEAAFKFKLGYDIQSKFLPYVLAGPVVANTNYSASRA
jgi:opacity protein-like surface antigen